MAEVTWLGPFFVKSLLLQQSDRVAGRHCEVMKQVRNVPHAEESSGEGRGTGR